MNWRFIVDYFRLKKAQIQNPLRVINLPTFRCPNCGYDRFLEGPHGGEAVNFCCEKCHMRFNDMGIFGIDGYGFVKDSDMDLFRRGIYTPSTTRYNGGTNE